MNPTDNTDTPTMKAWQATAYNGEIQKMEIPIPEITNSGEILVRVIATSVNTLDVMMLDGYGRVLLSFLKNMGTLFRRIPEFPFTLGRDFVGEVVTAGDDSKFEAGDLVMGVTMPFQHGCLAEYVVIQSSYVTKKPQNLTIEEASSLLFAGLTAWSAFNLSAGFFLFNPRGKKVLVIGGSGGVGTIAIQLLKTWGVIVTTTVNRNAIDMVKNLNPDNIVDYTNINESLHDALNKFGPFDVIFDAAGLDTSEWALYQSHLKKFNFSSFITLVPPTLKNVDNFGILFGNVKNCLDLFFSNFGMNLTKLSTVRWGYFYPFTAGIKELSKLSSERKVVPVIHNVYSFDKVDDAYRRMKAGHLRGKIVIRVSNNN